MIWSSSRMVLCVVCVPFDCYLGQARTGLYWSKCGPIVLAHFCHWTGDIFHLLRADIGMMVEFFFCYF